MTKLVEAGLAALLRRYRRVVPLGEARIARGDRAVFDAECDGVHLVVKVDAHEDRWRNEVEAMRALAPLLPVAPLALAEPGPPALLAYPYLAGEALAARRDEASWREAGRLVARLHAVPRACPPWHASEWGVHLLERSIDELARARRAELLDLAQARALSHLFHERFTGLTLDRCSPLHGDCTPEHILMAPGQPVVARLLDLGDAGCGDAALDLVSLSLDHPAHGAPLLAGYAPAPPLGARLAATGDAYRALRHLGLARWRHEHGLDASDALARLRALAAGGESAIAGVED